MAAPVKVNIQTQVVVDSHGSDALQPEYPERGSCSFHSLMRVFFELSSQRAFFKLESPVVLLVPSPETHRNDTVRSNLYLCIRPEHIISLVHDRPQLPEILALLGKKTPRQKAIRLQFTLSKSPEWVVPNFGPLTPKAPEDAHLLAAFQRLATAQSVTVYMSGAMLSEIEASSLCHAASTSGQLNSSTVLADFQRWYLSPGGKIVPPDGIANIISADRPTESPPSNDDLSHSSQGPREESASRKRKQASSGGQERLFDENEVEDSIRKAGKVVNRLRDVILEAEKKKALLKERISQADQRLVHLAEATAEDKESQVEPLKQYVENRLEKTRVDIREFIDGHLDELSIDVVLKSEMENYVDEAIRAAADDLREKVER